MAAGRIVLTNDQYAVFEQRVLSHYAPRLGRKRARIGEKVHPLTRDSRKDY